MSSPTSTQTHFGQKDSQSTSKAALEAMLAPHVTIVLVNYRGANDTLACLESFQTLDYASKDIIVVDNNSGDDSIELLKASRFKFELICSDINLGFSGGNNLAIKKVLERKNDKDLENYKPTDYIWLLNNDTEVGPSALTNLVKEAQKTGGITGSLLLYPDKQYQMVGTQINWLTGGTKGYKETELENGMSVECVSGASMLIPTSLFKRIGLMDESYFLYFEDSEFCLRAREKNYPVTLAIGSRVYHKEGATTGKKSFATQYYFHRNRLKVLFQYASVQDKIPLAIYSAFRLLRDGLKALLQPKRRLNFNVQWIAFNDFIKGIDGPCPAQHNLDHQENQA